MIHTFPDRDAAATALAAQVAGWAAEAIAARGAFRIALSGGTTPAPLYARLAGSEAHPIDWARVVVLFADERAVPPDDPESNYALVRRTLLDPLGAGAPQVRRMRGEAIDLAAAAREYEPELATPLDLALLGMGPDGHVASLFPHGSGLREATARVAAIEDSPKPPPRRLTLTARALREARHAAVLCAGADKAAAVVRALIERPALEECPATLLADREWYLDAAAATALPR